MPRNIVKTHLNHRIREDPINHPIGLIPGLARAVFDVIRHLLEPTLRLLNHNIPLQPEVASDDVLEVGGPILPLLVDGVHQGGILDVQVVFAREFLALWRALELLKAGLVEVGLTDEDKALKV